MRASIIIPTYNRAEIVLRSIETWKNQTLDVSDYEVIIVDNNSSDNSSSLINEFIKDIPNFHYLLENKPGSTNARQSAVKESKYDYLIFADDDGLYNSTCIEEILKVYESNDEIDAVSGKIDILWDKTPPEWIDPYEFMLGKLNYGDNVVVAKNIYLNGGLFSIKKSVFNELNGFNPDLIGDYLVGDGDTGLVIKLHNENRLIGWTPFAQMQHLQFVNKQGTEMDMGRRFYNIGISLSYGMFRANAFKFDFKVVKYILNSILLYCKKNLEYNLSCRNSRKLLFSLLQRKGELTFFVHLRKSKVRKMIYDD